MHKKKVYECKLHFVEPYSKDHIYNNEKYKFHLKEVLKYSVKDQKLHDHSMKPTLHRRKSQDSSVKSGNLKDHSNQSNSYNG